MSQQNNSWASVFSQSFTWGFAAIGIATGVLGAMFVGFFLLVFAIWLGVGSASVGISEMEREREQYEERRDELLERKAEILKSRSI